MLKDKALKIAVENYIFALKQLRRASAKLGDMGVSVPCVDPAIHICFAKQETWLKLKELAENPDSKVEVRTDSDYPAEESFLYNDTKIFRLLRG